MGFFSVRRVAVVLVMGAVSLFSVRLGGSSGARTRAGEYREGCSQATADEADRFATGFGETGNNAWGNNMMGHPSVGRVSAEVLISKEPEVLTTCPDALGPAVWVGPEGAQRLLCGINQLSDKFPVFSFGSNGEFQFEDAVRKIKPHIPVVVFDPTMGDDQCVRAQGEVDKALNYAKEQDYKFVTTGLAYRNGMLFQEDRNMVHLFEAPVATLQECMAAAGHDDIGVLKIDISGEFEIFDQLKATNFPLGEKVGILTVEAHMYHPQLGSTRRWWQRKNYANCCYGPMDLDGLLSYIASEGFVMVGYEGHKPKGCCAEFSFVNPGFKGFQ